MAVPFYQLHRRAKDSPLRFQPVDQSERQKLAQHGQEVQRFREQRQKLESQVAAPSAAQPAKQLAPATVKLPTVSDCGAGQTRSSARTTFRPRCTWLPSRISRSRPSRERLRSPEQPQPRTVNRLPLDTPQPQPQPSNGRRRSRNRSRNREVERPATATATSAPGRTASTATCSREPNGQHRNRNRSRAAATET